MLSVFSSQVLAETVFFLFAKFALKIFWGDILGEIFSLFEGGNAVHFCTLVFFRHRPSLLQSSRRRYFWRHFQRNFLCAKFFFGICYDIAPFL